MVSTQRAQRATSGITGGEIRFGEWVPVATRASEPSPLTDGRDLPLGPSAAPSLEPLDEDVDGLVLPAAGYLRRRPAPDGSGRPEVPTMTSR